LRVHVSLSQNSTEEFEHFKKNVDIYVKKLKRIEMHMYQIYLYFTMKMLMNVFYGCGIVKFSLYQCEVLKKTYEIKTF